MSTISVTNVKHESSASNNLVLDSSANTTVGGNLIAQAGSAATPSIQATGDTNTGIYFSAADTVDIATGGTQRAQLDSSGNFLFNSGYGSVATAYGVRAWINFDGSAATIGTGRGSGNMDAVTDNGTGDYTVNFTNDMPDVNYAVAGCCMETGSTGATDNFIGVRRATNYSDSIKVGSVRIATNGGGDREIFVMVVR